MEIVIAALVFLVVFLAIVFLSKIGNRQSSVLSVDSASAEESAPETHSKENQADQTQDIETQEEVPTPAQSFNSAPDASEPRPEFLRTFQTSALSVLLPHEFVVLNLETTGPNATRHEILEVGAIRVNLELDSFTNFQAIVKSSRKVPKKIAHLTGISQSMVDREGLPLRTVLAEFLRFAGNLPIVTFDASSGMRFIHEAAKKHELVFQNQYACALSRARRAWPALESYRLADFPKTRNLPLGDAHRALGDCRRTAIVFLSATSELGQKVKWTKPLPRALAKQSK